MHTRMNACGRQDVLYFGYPDDMSRLYIVAARFCRRCWWRFQYTLFGCCDCLRLRYSIRVYVLI
jgi:hypothetical protein